MRTTTAWVVLAASSLLVAVGCTAEEAVNCGSEVGEWTTGEDAAGGDVRSRDGGVDSWPGDTVGGDADTSADGTHAEDADGGEGRSFVEVSKPCRENADHRIDVYLPSEQEPSGFQPKDVTIQEGETVVWKNMSFGSHVITSGRPLSSRAGSLFIEYLAGAEARICMEFGQLSEDAGGSREVEYFCGKHDHPVATITVTE